MGDTDSQGLSSLVPNLSLEDHIYQAEELISLTDSVGQVTNIN